MSKLKKWLEDVLVSLVGNVIWVIILAIFGGEASIALVVYAVKTFGDKELTISLGELLLVFFLITLIVILIVLLVFATNRLFLMIENRKIFSRLSKYVTEHNYVKSIQLYSCNTSYSFDPIPADDLSDFVVTVNRLGGVEDECYKTNCILFDDFTVPADFIVKYVDMIKMIKEDQDLIKSGAYNLDLLDEHVTTLRKKCVEIKKKYFINTKLNELTLNHYIYYRLLFILVSKGCELHKIVQKYKYNKHPENWKDECDYILGKSLRDLEKKLKSGKRSQFYSVVFFNDLYCFEHEDDALKEGRCYFSAKYNLPNKDEEYLMIVTYDPSRLGAVSKSQKYNMCDTVRKDIIELIVNRRSYKNVTEK